MSIIMSWDIETKSLVNLIKQGSYAYAEDASTDILCMAYAFGDDDPILWHPKLPPPADFLEHIKNGGLIAGWNILNFDVIVYNAWVERNGLDWPLIEREQCRDTMCAARLSHFPGGLGNAGKFLLSDLKASIKNPEGDRLIKLLCIPMCVEPEQWHPHTQADLDEMYEYNLQDVVAERELARMIPVISDVELEVMFMHDRMNARGVMIDLDLAGRAIKLARQEKASLDLEMQRVTGGAINSCTQVQKIKAYLSDRYGLELAELNKDFLRENLPDDVPEGASDILKLRLQSSRSSVSKFRAMINRTTADGRLKGMFLFAGAGATGRTSSIAAQLQNLPRKVLENFRVAYNIMERGTDYDIKEIYGKNAGVYSLLSESVRLAIVPAPGHKFCVLDYSAIEARKIAWLAGDEKTLQHFRSGMDIYKATYAGTYNIYYDDVTDAQRVIGKVMTLSMGFQGGHKALAKMALKFGVRYEEVEANQIKKDWRTSHPEIVEYWALLEIAIHAAMKNPNKIYRVGGDGDSNHLPPVYYGFDGTHLYCQLPSGRRLTYPFARRHTDDTPYGPKVVVSYAKAAWLPKQGEPEWPRATLYGGLACENITQASSRDLLMYASVEIEAEGIPLVMTVHDEVIAEVPAREAQAAFGLMKVIMETTPRWAEGLPLNAEGGIMSRYGKA